MKYYTSTTEFNCWIDLHARQMFVCVTDRLGKVLVHRNVIGNDFGFFLKRVEPYPAARRPIRALLRQRMSYVWQRAALMPHLSMNQTAEGLIPADKAGHNRDVWSEQILAQYENPLHRLAVTCEMDVIRAYDRQIEILEQEITRQAKTHDGRDYHLITTVPGIGRILAMTILFEMDTVTRFPTVKDFTSYARLVKGSVASAGKLKGLTGGKMGNGYLRWAFGEATVIAKRNHPLLTPYAEKLVAKRGKFKGNAILANKLARAVYFMLQKGKAFDAERLIATSI